MRGGSLVVGLLALLTIGACAAICGIVALHLNNVTFSTNQGVAVGVGECALGSTSTMTNLCTWAYIGAGVGAGLALIMAIVGCITCKCCGWGHIFDFIIGIVGTAWMAAFGIMLYLTSQQSQNKDLPNSSWRFATWLCFFIGAALFLIMTLLSGVLMCMGCCGGKKKKPIAADMEAAKTTDPYVAPDTATTYGTDQGYPATTQAATYQQPTYTTTAQAPTTQYV